MNDPSVSDFDGDGVPNDVELVTGTNPFDPRSGTGTKAAMDLAGDVAEAVGKTAAAAVGKDVVGTITDAVGDMIEDAATPPVSMRLPEPPPARRVELTDVRDDASVEDFMVNVLAEVGDRYQRGVENSLRNANPDSWDGSELVEWGANRAGSMVNDGAQNQYKQMVRHGGDVSIDVALVTPGAILYEFTGDPSGSAKPTRASTAISLGDGKHIIDIDPVLGVRIVEAKDFTFTHAGVMPGFVDAHKPGPMTHALVEEALKSAGLEPGPALQVVTPSTTPDADPDAPPAKGGVAPESTDDDHGTEIEDSPTSEDGGAPTPDSTPPAPSAPADAPTPTPTSPPPPPDTAEITALAGRAAQLRARYNERLSSQERIDLVDRRDDIGLQHATAKDGASWSKHQLEDRLKQANERLTEATDLDRRATEAQAAGKGRDAEDLREQAQAARGHAKALEALAERSRADIAKAEADVTRIEREHSAADERLERWDADRLAAEKVVDVVEEKVRLLREAEEHDRRAKNHDDDAQWFRDNGDPQEADNRAAMAAKARADADAARTTSRSTDVDEGTLRKGGILTGDETIDSLPPIAPTTATSSAEPTRTVIAAADDSTAPEIDRTDVSPRPAEGAHAATDPSPRTTEETPAPRDPGAPQPSASDRAGTLEARAKALRTELLERQAVGRAEDLKEVHEQAIRELEIRAGAEEASIVKQLRESQAADARKDVTRLEAEAATAEKRGDAVAAEELREEAAGRAAVATRLEAVARESADDAARRLAEADAIQVERLKLRDAYQEDGRQLTAAETAIDQIETKARLYREAEAHAKRAVDLESEAALLRDQGKVVEADAKHAAAGQARSSARQSETLAAAQPIDEAKISEAGLLGGPTTPDAAEAATSPQASLLDDVTGATGLDVANAGAGDPEAPPRDGVDDAEVSTEAAADAAVADAPPAQDDQGIDAHATAATLVPDLPDPSAGLGADDASAGDAWADAGPEDAAPAADDAPPDLEV